MKHQVKNYKLGRTTNQRKALKYSLIRSLVLHKKIVSTHAKCKFIQPITEKLITSLKEDSLNSYRKALSFFRNDEVTAKMAIELAKKAKDIKGGYTKVVKLGQREGDGAHKGCIMFCGGLE